MGKAAEVVTPPAPVAVEEQPVPDEDPPGPKTLISLEQLEQLNVAKSAAERVDRLQCALGVQHYSVNPSTSVWVDFCFGVLTFAQDDAHLPPEKALVLLTLAHEVYMFGTHPVESATDSPLSNHSESISDENADLHETTAEVSIKAPVPMPTAQDSPDAYHSVEAVYDQFREKIRYASGAVADGDIAQDLVDASPSPVQRFSPMEVARIVAFFTSTFFRHLRAYQYLNRVPRPCIMRECPLPTETPLPPLSLADAIME
ncbi:hypothetical protein P3T76_007951 [Phytophthora citrophthora]|uniref:Uncharacterized protein n=1 Tax=Phytophthora citrophthora TaxID=4793 RepID=A0AAD9GL94_9STRA|nr:hypothetical protein P3T76_007951 [Phytophthora citrophthora]